MLDYKYHWYKIEQILYVLKDVLVQYLGYHSVERLPKTITTSVSNIYETFYNYILNEYNIVQIPQMLYNIEKKEYMEYVHNPFLVSDRELRLKKELQSIKKLVPLNERYKYYR